MNDRVCVVTGATGGIGYETARGIARQGATVVIVGRSAEKSRAAVEQIARETGNPRVECLIADLSIQADIRRLAGEIGERYPRLNVLVNNAGGVYMNGQMSADGIEMTLALNHLGYYLLARLLSPFLKINAPARIVNVSSFAHIGARIDFPALEFSGWSGYKRSKLANLLFTYELARRMDGTGVTVNALSPGFVASNFGLNNRGLLATMKPMMNWFAVSNETGARTSVYLATSPDVDGVTGKYFSRSKPRRSSRISTDRGAAATLWEISARMTGLTAD
ncbi:MAG: SDR family oxidoreductase [Acidobacteria bacterium]|nr:SDR family oxidoreductase [Acidobacteriota bacterium]